MQTKRCDACNAPLQDAKWQSNALCPACRDKLLDDMRDARPAKSVFPASWTFDDKVDKARELGISYGQFKANAENGMYDMKTLKKADRSKILKPGVRDLVRKIYTGEIDHNRVK